MRDLDRREFYVLGTLVFMILFFGIFPNHLVQMFSSSVNVMHIQIQKRESILLMLVQCQGLAHETENLRAVVRVHLPAVIISFWLLYYSGSTGDSKSLRVSSIISRSKPFLQIIFSMPILRNTWFITKISDQGIVQKKNIGF